MITKEDLKPALSETFEEIEDRLESLEMNLGDEEWKYKELHKPLEAISEQLQALNKSIDMIVILLTEMIRDNHGE